MKCVPLCVRTDASEVRDQEKLEKESGQMAGALPPVHAGDGNAHLLKGGQNGGADTTVSMNTGSSVAVTPSEQCHTARHQSKNITSDRGALPKTAFDSSGEFVQGVKMGDHDVDKSGLGTSGGETPREIIASPSPANSKSGADRAEESAASGETTASVSTSEEEEDRSIPAVAAEDAVMGKPPKVPGALTRVLSRTPNRTPRRKTSGGNISLDFSFSADSPASPYVTTPGSDRRSNRHSTGSARSSGSGSRGGSRNPSPVPLHRRRSESIGSNSSPVMHRSHSIQGTGFGFGYGSPPSGASYRNMSPAASESRVRLGGGYLGSASAGSSPAYAGSPPGSSSSAQESRSSVDGRASVGSRRRRRSTGKLAPRKPGQSLGLVQEEKPVERRRVLSADMPESMQRDAIECASRAMAESDDPKDVAAAIKKAFDEMHPCKWHCVVGSSFGSFVTHDVGNFIYFHIGKNAVLLFKADG